MANANLFQQYLQPARSVVDYSNDYAKADALRNQNALQSLTLQQAAAVNGQKNALRAAVQGGLDLTSDAGQSQALSIAPDVAPGVLKTIQDNVTSKAAAQKDLGAANASNATAAKTKQDTQWEMLQHGIQSLTSAATQEAAIQAINDGVSKGYWGMDDAQKQIAQVPTDPTAYQAFRIEKLKQILPMADLLKANTQSISTRNTGATTDTLASDPLTGATQVVSSVKNTISPDAQLSAQTSRANTAATINAENTRAANSLAVEKVKADPFGALGLNTNAPAATKAAAGLSGDAYLQTLDPGVASQVKALAEGRLQISPQFTRTPQGSALIQMAMQYDPGTDQTTYSERNKTAQSFAPGGKDGSAITNLNTAIHHAGQLSDAIDKLDNSNVLPGLTNPVENYVGQKLLGQTTQGVYKQKADALASELRKVYAGGGGGSLSELNEWQKSFDQNASKDQQKAYLQSGMELLLGALQAKQDAYQRGMGPRANFGQFITPESKAVLTRLA